MTVSPNSARLAELLDAMLPLAARLEALLPEPPGDQIDWERVVACQWRRRRTAFGTLGRLVPVTRIAPTSLADLHNIDENKRLVARNTERFVRGLPANNVLLTGARGTGKSSLIRACLNAYASQGLRLIEIDKDDLVDLPDVIDCIAHRPERFIVYCDDLSFEQGEGGYKALKTVLDGSVSGASDNVLVYATSNRRHLMPEYMSENLQASHQEDGEIHPGETSEEKVSLSERFGLWVAFYPFRQDDYLAVVAHWLRTMGATEAEIEAARGDALRWALERGSRSGRVAWQFARDYVDRPAAASPPGGVPR